MIVRKNLKKTAASSVKKECQADLKHNDKKFVNQKESAKMNQLMMKDS